MISCSMLILIDYILVHTNKENFEIIIPIIFLQLFGLAQTQPVSRQQRYAHTVPPMPFQTQWTLYYTPLPPTIGPRPALLS